MRLLMLTMLPSLDLSPGQTALYGDASLFNMRESEELKHTSSGPPPPLHPMSVPMLPKKLRKTAKRTMPEDRTWRPAAVKKAAVLNPAWVRTSGRSEQRSFVPTPFEPLEFLERFSAWVTELQVLALAEDTWCPLLAIHRPRGRERGSVFSSVCTLASGSPCFFVVVGGPESLYSRRRMDEAGLAPGRRERVHGPPDLVDVLHAL